MSETSPQLVYFIHVPKTAGTYVTSFLQDQLGEKFVREGHTVPPHALHPWTERFGPTHYGRVDKRDCHTFSVVRNPFGLLVSMYLFGFPYWSPKTVAGQQQIVWPFSCFRDYATKLCAWNDYPWICPEQQKSLFFQLFDEDGNCFADTILRQELLDEGLQALGAKLGQAWHPPTARINASNSHDYRDFYDEELVQIIGTKFAADLDTFGYGFEQNDRRVIIEGAQCRLDPARRPVNETPFTAMVPARKLAGTLADRNFHKWDETLLHQYSGRFLAKHLLHRFSNRLLHRSAIKRAET